MPKPVRQRVGARLRWQLLTKPEIHMAHPRYLGIVIDAHCHYHPATREHVRAANVQGGLAAAVSLWDADWPPLPYHADLEAWQAVEPGLFRCHVPNVGDVDNAGPDGLAQAVRDAASPGAVGVKIWKNLGLWLRDASGQRLAVDDARFSPIWEVASELSLPVVIHQGDPPAFFAPLDDTNPRIAELRVHPDWWYGCGDYASLDQILDELEHVIAVNPRTNFIAAHFGSFMSWPEVRRMLGTYPNYHVDTAAAIADMGRRPVRDDVREIIVNYQDRVVFGTDLIRTVGFDMPEVPDSERWDLTRFFDLHWRFFESDERGLEHPLPAQGDWQVDGLDLPEAVLEKLYWSNAVRLFRLPCVLSELIASPRNL